MPPCKAAVTITDAGNTPLFFSGTFYIDFNGDSTNDLMFRTTEMAMWIEALGATETLGHLAPPPNLSSYTQPVHTSELIGPVTLSPWSWNSAATGPSTLQAAALFSGTVIRLGYWASNTDYVGVRFLAGGEVHYGWVEVEVPFDGFPGGYIKRYAWESEPNTPITAGALPEPSRTLLLLFGILPLLHRRRRALGAG